MQQHSTTGMPRFLSTSLLFAGLISLFIAERILSEGGVRTFFLGLCAVLLVGGLAQRILQWRSEKDAKQKVEAYLLFSSAGIVLSLLLYFARSDAGIELFGLTGDSAAHFKGAVTAFWPAVLCVSLSTHLFIEFVYSRMPISEAVELRRVHGAAKTGLTLSLSLVFLFSVNYVASQREFKRDLSYFKTSKPSEGTLSMVKRLSGDPVRVVLFYPKVSDVLGQMTPYFESIDKASSKISVEIKDHALAPELVKQHRIRGNGIVLLLQGDGKNAKAQSFEIGDDLELARGKLKKLDEHFQQNLTKLTRPPRSLHLSVGHREYSSAGQDGDAPGQRTQNLQTLLGRFNISTKELGLAQGLAQEVPADTRAIAILGPREAFLPEEAQALGRYVQHGGRVLVNVDPDSETGLEPFFSLLGIKVEQGILNSKKQHMRRSFTPADHEIVFTNNYSSHPTVTTASGHSREAATVFLRGGALSRLEEKADAISLKPSVIFPMRSGIDSFLDLNDDHEQNGNESSKSYNMMAAITVNQPKGEEGRVVVIADGDFATDQLIRVPGNTLVLVDSLRWLIGEEEIAASLTSEEDIPIEHTRDEDKIWFYATAFGLPLPLLALGIWMARRRRRRSEARS
ncbi:MAG: Gldg family protein [Myxococcales bacterium]|nr:MAG: Gldg family protein [Myxococcales bacterium]